MSYGTLRCDELVMITAHSYEDIALEALGHDRIKEVLKQDGWQGPQNSIVNEYVFHRQNVWRGDLFWTLQ
jgi:hypothetical protein